MSAAILNKLYSFKNVDKCDAFKDAQPGILHTSDPEKQAINEILDLCCKALIVIFEDHKKPSGVILRQTIREYMEMISAAPINMEAKDFGYELCWFLAEKAQIELKKNSERKAWGFWKIEAGEVKTITAKPIRQKKSKNAKHDPTNV